MMAPLTPNMWAALADLDQEQAARCDWHNMRTISALRKRGLIERKPKTHVWILTEAGKALLNEVES